MKLMVFTSVFLPRNITRRNVQKFSAIQCIVVRLKTSVFAFSGEMDCHIGVVCFVLMI